MFDKLFNRLEGQKDEMRSRLAGEILEVEVGDGTVHLKANGNREILDISINREKISLENLDELEDLLVVGVNQLLEMAAEREAAEAQKMIHEMIPPGLGGLFGMKS